MSLAAAVLALMLVPALAQAHVERAGYWPNDAPDCEVEPCAGGEVPAPRSLASALDAAQTKVVCQPDSIARLQRAIDDAKTIGYKLRPTQAPLTISAAEGRALLDLNRKLLKRCAFSSIQAAVNASGNNGRVVIMPGLYTEPASRAAPTDDPACEQYQLPTNDKGQTGALSYKSQYFCPNDQNLIAILGREPGATDPPDPPRVDRHRIPDEGRCIRCNLQIEGSGPSPDDVVIDAGRPESGDGPPAMPAKDVGFRIDRADGTVIRNLKVRHAREHSFYVLETDGYLLDRFKSFYSGEYGVLTFVADHGVMQNCEAMGSGDSGLYPGASADTGHGRDRSYYPDFRYSQTVRLCDSHHNTSGYSGTVGNAVHVDSNNFYDNALGFTTDVFTAPGHPGFPQDSALVENNKFYSNNFNPYLPGSDVTPTVPVPVGTGMWIAGGNDNIVRNNHFYDNWRRGVMLFAVPDQVVCGPIGIDPTLLAGCNPTAVPPSTSYRNAFYGNSMGRSPGVLGSVQPNGTGDVTTGRTDFWWDQYLGNTGNCWYDNTGKYGTALSVTSTPSAPLLPSQCNETSIGTVGPQQEPELLNCLADIEFDTGTCSWFTTPTKP